MCMCLTGFLPSWHVGEGRGGCDELWLGCVCHDLDLHGRRGCRRRGRHPCIAVEQNSVVALSNTINVLYQYCSTRPRQRQRRGKHLRHRSGMDPRPRTSEDMVQKGQRRGQRQTGTNSLTKHATPLPPLQPLTRTRQQARCTPPAHSLPCRPR